MPDQTAPAEPHLQFETAHPSDATAPAACASCSEPIRNVYYEANGSVVCSRCRGKLETLLGTSGGVRRFRRALGFGICAAIAGAVFYYGFREITGIDFGLVAVLVGFIVGKAVFVGTERRGGRRYQILAVVLTYFAIASTYVPLAVREAKGTRAVSGDSSKAAGRNSVVADSTTAADSTVGETQATPSATARATVATKRVGVGSFLLGMGVMLVLTATLPIIVGFGSIISIVILGVGLLQAWRMNKAVNITVSGPYRIAGLPTEAGLAT